MSFTHDAWLVLREYLLQLRILLKKSFKLSYRGWKTTAAQLLAPVAFLLLLLIIQYVPTSNGDDDNPKSTPVPNLPLCHGRDKRNTDCYPLFYSPNDTVTNNIMSILAQKNNLTISFDLKDKQHIIGWEGNSTAVREWIRLNPNKTLGYLEFESITGNNVNYILNYNSSCPSIGFTETCYDWRPVLLRAVSEALAAYYSGRGDTTFSLFTSTYPVIAPPSDAVKSYGALFFYCGSMFFFIILLYQVVYEKEYKLRQGMRMMGLKSSMYWLAWFIESQIINILSTLLIICVGLACDFAFFRTTDFAVLLIVFYLFIFAMAQMAFFFSTILPTTKLAIYMSMMVFIIGALLCLIFSLFGAGIFPLMYSGGSIATPFRYILSFIPMFNFSKAVFDINSLSYTLGEIKGTGFTWSNLYDDRKLGNDDDATVIPATIESLYYQLGLVGIFTVLAWYCDNAIPGASGGASYGPFFFLRPRYWGFNSHSQGSKDGYEVLDAEKESNLSERAGGPEPALQCMRLIKIYQGIPFVHRSGDVLALRGFSATIDEGQIFCLLGHNGAGKTTTVNILTGLFEPTYGDAFIYGLSVVNQMETIRRIMGVCPQHDILWNELTAREHLEIFAELKNVPSADVASVVDEKLKSVNLYDVGDKLVGGFSGGMKRRLSVAISCIGDPKIIFMDEPTTGMDPVSRRHVWNLIQQLKKNRVIILTTHSMEEADVLGDRIAIMSHGTIRCMGTSLHLKNQYGEGYRLNVTARPDAIPEAKEFVFKSLPESFIIAETAEYLVYGLPHSSLNRIAPFFRAVEEMKQDDTDSDLEDESAKPIIRDCSISHTTLEEVFLKITRQANVDERNARVNPWEHLSTLSTDSRF